MKNNSPTLRNVGVPMSDGTTLAVDVYLPMGDGPWPTVLVYTPYLKDSNLGVVCANYLAHFTKHGYAAAIADFRGTGSSEGVKTDAFEVIESSDVYDLIEHLAGERWCNGNVGMWGVSYGGISALRAAGARPPHLRAVVAVEGSTDPYKYEVMRNGAPGLAMIVGEWASMMLCLNSVPPINGTPNENASAVWAAHLDALTPWHFSWRDHTIRDAYWQGRDVDPGIIEVPTMIISGWRDTQVLGAWRDYTALSGPRRLIIGPWQHGLPDMDATDPIHSIHEMISWFDIWLHDEPRVVNQEAPVSLYVLGTGEWESYNQWPLQTRARTLYLTGAGGLCDTADPDVAQVLVEYDATVGIHGGLGMGHGPADQRGDDDRSTLFITEPLSESLEVVGQVDVTLNIEFAQVDTDIAIRIVDVAPNGTSTLITKGFLRLSNPPQYTGAALQPPTASVSVHCNPTRYHIDAGHRVRLAIAAADFPEIWPSPVAADYTIVVGGGAAHGSSVTFQEPLNRSISSPVFEAPDPELAWQLGLPSRSTLELVRSDATGLTSVKGSSTMSMVTFDGHQVDFTHIYSVSTAARRPEFTRLVTESAFSIQQPHRQITVNASTYSNTDIAAASVSISIDGTLVFAETFRHRPPGSVVVQMTGSLSDRVLQPEDADHHGN